MSYKGITRGIARVPQQFKAKFNLGEVTKDQVYIDAERRFKEFDQDCKKLNEEFKRYFNAIKEMLKHQIEFSRANAELYKPISGSPSDPDREGPIEGHPEGIKACEEFEGIVQSLLDSLEPDLEEIERHIISPADQLQIIIKAMDKMCTKRAHKQLDYDRHRTSLKKLEEKKNKNVKDEKHMLEIQAQVDEATQEYEHYNDMLKEELPKLFELQADFIKPLLCSFYYMQLDIFYTLHDRMQGLEIPYFDFTYDIEEGFERKSGDARQRAEDLNIVHARAGRSATLMDKVRGSGKQSSASPRRTSSSYRRDQHEAAPPPTYAAATSSSAPPASQDAPPMPTHPSEYPADNVASQSNGSLTNRVSSLSLSASAKKKPPPPLPSKPSRLTKQVETVTALYPFEAQTDDDLSFDAGDKIEIVSRTDDPNQWWKGRLSGHPNNFVGSFPGNYVQLD